jgi:hypothetical protein
MARAVGTVIAWPIIISSNAPQKPSVPTAKPNLRKSIARRIVEMAVKKTGRVPNLFLADGGSMNYLNRPEILSKDVKKCSKVVI